MDQRLVALARVHRRVESVLCFYLQEVENRRLYLKYGLASTVDYARERLGFEDRRTEAKWLHRCKSLSNRQLGQEVKRKQPPTQKKTLFFVLEGDHVEAWEQAREALERLAGKSLSDLEVFDLMCVEALCGYATALAFGDGEKTDGDFAREVAERDGWKCTRPGCSNPSALTANQVVSRAQGGPDDDWNLHTVCAVCHAAITEGRLKVKGRAPDGLAWEEPFRVIESRCPWSGRRRTPRRSSTAGRLAGVLSRESRKCPMVSSLGLSLDHMI